MNGVNSRLLSRMLLLLTVLRPASYPAERDLNIRKQSSKASSRSSTYRLNRCDAFCHPLPKVNACQKQQCTVIYSHPTFPERNSGVPSPIKSKTFRFPQMAPFSLLCLVDAYNTAEDCETAATRNQVNDHLKRSRIRYPLTFRFSVSY